jgi:hypothetical protein
MKMRAVNNNFQNWLRLLIVAEYTKINPQNNRIELLIENRGSSALYLAESTKQTAQPEMKMSRYLQTGDRLESSVNRKFRISD